MKVAEAVLLERRGTVEYELAGPDSPSRKEHRKAQLKTRLKAGESWQDNDLIFCKDDGTPIKPDAVTRRFERLAAMTAHYTHIEAEAHKAAAEAVARLVEGAGS